MAETAGILTLLLEVGKLVYSPIKRQCMYLFCLNSNVQALKNEAELLEVQKGRLNDEAGRSMDRGQVINDNVTDWFTRADGIKEEVRKIVEGFDNVQSGCLGIKSRYALSKKAMKMTEESKLHRDKKFDGPIAHSPPPQAQFPTPSIQASEFPSRKEIEENVMNVLRQRKPGVIGICGMGGLGKTTMIKKLMVQVSENKLFDEMAMVVVGKDATTFNIQRDIAKMLGLQLKYESIPARAHELRQRLSGGKRIFIVLDDIWNPLEFEGLGIPCEACTILLTSRDKDLLKKMDVNVFTMKQLNDKEALDLFIEKAQIDRVDRNLVPIAEVFVRECQGLPLTLVIIGSLLKDKKKTAIWNDLLIQLKIYPILIKKVYRSLKFSYDKLNNVDAQKLFLLCSQFPEDWNINLHHLALYCVGLHLFEKRETLNLEQTRNRLCTVVEMLKSRSMLLHGRGSKFVRMHDVVRDVAGVITDEESSAPFVRHCKFMFNRDSGLPSRSTSGYKKFDNTQ